MPHTQLARHQLDICHFPHVFATRSLACSAQRQDFRVNCESGEFRDIHRLSLVLFVLLAVLPPVLFGIFISLKHKQGRLSDIRCSLGFLFSGYVEQVAGRQSGRGVFPWWESVACLRRVVISAIVTLVRRPEDQVGTRTCLSWHSPRALSSYPVHVTRHSKR